jgi:hypothetical protein
VVFDEDETVRYSNGGSLSRRTALLPEQDERGFKDCKTLLGFEDGLPVSNRDRKNEVAESQLFRSTTFSGDFAAVPPRKASTTARPVGGFWSSGFCTL